MAVNDRVMVRGGADMAGTVVWLGSELALVRWDNGQTLAAWAYSLIAAR
jgi:hypothetical protein